MGELFGGCVFISLFKMKKRIHTFGKKKKKSSLKYQVKITAKIC